MAGNQPKDILSRVADLGEEALGKLPGFPGADKLTEFVNQNRVRLDEMQKKLRGLDVLEQRVNDLEQRLAELEQPEAPKPTPKAQPPRKSTTPEPPASA